MLVLDWVLALCAVVVWVGPITYYFRHELRTYWIRRHDKWFRQD